MENFIYNQYSAQQKQTVEDKEKAVAFLKRIEPFKNAMSVMEAKRLAKEILPVNNEVTRFYVGDIKCTVINRENSFRLSVDSPEEFISYDFS